MKTLFAISADGDMDDSAVEAEFCGKNRDEEPGIRRVEEHLEQGIEGNQASRIFGIAAGQFVPDDDHRDTAGQADHDESSHVFGIAAQKHDGQDEHQDRADHPVLDEG